MEILSNFSLAYYIISFILGAIFMLTTFCIAAMSKTKESRNNVHFYVARDKSGVLSLYFGKPYRRNDSIFSDFLADGIRLLACDSELKWYGLNPDDFKDLKWEDEPVEVFINIED